MHRRDWTGMILLALALMLAGLGHYYLLYQRVYVWDAVVFYAGAGGLLCWAWLRAEEIPEQSWKAVQASLRMLQAAVQDLLHHGLSRVHVLALAVMNGLAALAASRMAFPGKLWVVVPVWVCSAVVLGWLVVRSRVEGAAPEMPAAGSDVLVDTGPAVPERYGVPVVTGGWLLLIAATMLLGLDETPEVLQSLNAWLQPCLQGLHADLPVQPGVWVPGLLMSLLGTGLMGWGGRMKAVPSLTIDASDELQSGKRSARRRGVGAIASFVWLTVVYASVTGLTHWSVLPLWLLALALLAVFWWQADRGRGVAVLPHSVRPSTWLLAPVTVAALAVGLYRLGEVPNSIWGDEGAFWTIARDLARGASVNPFDLGVYEAFPMMSSIYQSLWIKLFGPSVWSWRLSSVVIGTLTVVPLFLLARKLLGRRVAWSAIALMVSMPYFLAYARMGYNNVQTLLPVTLGLWALILAVDRRSRLLSSLAGMAIGAGSLTYMAGHVGLVLAALTWGFLYMRWKPLRRRLMGLAPSFLMGWLFAAGPFVLGCALGDKPCGAKVAESFLGSAFYGEAVFSRQEITRLYPLAQLGQHQAFFEPRIYALLVGRGVVRTAISLVRDGVARYHYLLGPLAGPLPIFFLAGFGWLVGQWRRGSAAVWATWIVVCTVSLSMLNTFPPRAAHMVPVVPALAVVTAAGVWLFVDLLQPLLGRGIARWLGIGLVALMVMAGLHSYFVVMPQRYAPDMENVLFWRAREMAPRSDLVFVVDQPFPPGFRVWGIEQFDLPVDYHAVPAEKVGETDFAALCGSHCRVFFLPNNADVMREQLRSELGDGTVRPHLDAEGRTIGFEFVLP